jgi:hypothetical protein
MKDMYFLFIMLFLGILLGIALTMTYNSIMQTKEDNKLFDGLRFSTEENHTAALQHSYSIERNADWICVNVKGISFERGLEICNHEMAHEVFALKCQNNATRCMEAIK